MSKEIVNSIKRHYHKKSFYILPSDEKLPTTVLKKTKTIAHKVLSCHNSRKSSLTTG